MGLTRNLRSAVVSGWIPGQFAVFGVDVADLKILRCPRLVYRQPPRTKCTPLLPMACTRRKK